MARQTLLNRLIGIPKVYVDQGEVTALGVGRVKLRTLRGDVWVRSGMDLVVGDHVAFGRDREGPVVLQLVRKSRVATKVVKI